nr:MAG TPA: nuclease [Caudoviricetes sp.]
MSFFLSNKDYKEMIGIISGDTGGNKGNGASTTYLDTEFTAQEPKKQQGIVADTVDAVQMGAWKGVSDIAHGIGALTGADWLHDVGDWAAKGADENLATMSDEMKAALNQNAFDGEGQGVRNLRWWAGNLGSLIGQNLDTALTLGAGKVATIGAKQAGKLLLKKEVAEEVGKTAVEQAAKRGIPQKYWNMVGITATMSAMSGGGRYGQKRDEVMEMTNEQLAQIPQFSDEYYSIADSDEGKGKSTDELYTMAKKSFADKVGRDAALNPTAIATDLVTNAVSGLGGGFWGLGSPAKTIKGGLLKGAAVEGGTEAIQGIGEQYALNKADQKYFNPDKDLTEGMADNAINGAVLGAVFGSAMGGLDTHTDRIAFNNQKRTILNHINTGNDAVDSQLRNYVDMLNHGATELGDLVSASRVQALNNAGIATAKARQVAEEALAEQQAKARFESDFFDEEQPQQETTSTFKVDPNLERALELHSILGQFRKNDLSRANEFIDTPTIFADEQARKDYVTGRAFDEVRNIAQSYGIDPKDGKAMRRWLEDYAEKAKEYANDDPQAVAPVVNLQSTANIAPEFRNGVVSGANDEIDVGNGNYQPIQYEVVDASTLAPTQQKNENQFRDRDRASSQAQINNIARNLDPRKLASSPTMDVGAPLLALDGKTIIAGNGRTMAIRQAYQEGGADGYRQFLQDNSAQFGIDQAQLSEMENPVLVRRLTSPVDIAQVAINSNEQGGMRMSDLEQAKVDARRLPSMDNFVANDDGDINSADNQYFIGQFIKNQPENVRNELLDSRGNLSQTGVQRMRNAMLYEAYGDSQTLSRLIENTDQGAKNVLNALTSIAPKVAQTQQGIDSGKLSSDVNISKDVIQAVEKYNQLNAQGFKISDYLAQEDFVGDLSPEAREILTIFDDNRRSGKRITQVLGAYFDQAQMQGNLSQASMFGDVEFDKLGSLQQAKNTDETIRLSLNESANSDFAKAVDTTVQGGKPSKQYIPMGTTPSVLKMLGLPDTKVLVNRDVLRKVMLDKHNVTSETLKQLPKQINNPVAVMESAPRATHNGYIVLTELLERNISTGKDEPVISALHLKKTKDGIEVINIASVYGKNLGGLQNMLNHDLVYWNKTKGSQFIESFGLQLPSKIDSKTMSLSVDNIKTETDLSQYQAAKNNQIPQINPEIQRAQEILRKTFGKAAEHIEVTTLANPPKDVKNLITSDVEGWFNPKTGKVTLIADSINATKTMSKEERLQFVAWHEMAHRGINVGYKGSYDSLMQEVGKNKAISQIADAIQTQRKNTDDLAATNRSVAIEEAIAEMMAAHETGKWNELESRYGVEIKKGQRQSTKSWLAMTAQRIKDFLSKFFGVERAAQFSDEDVLNLISRIKNSSLNETRETGDLRFSRKGEPEYQRDLIVTHNISADGIMHADKMGGLPLASVAVAKQSNPLTNFGEVTLIGSRNYIDPKGVNKAKVFGSDIYSPRYPRISYEYSAKNQKALFNRFEKSAKEIEDRAFDYDFTQGLEDTGAKQAMLNSDAVKHQFLKEHNIPYEKAYRDIPKSVHADYPSIQKAIKAGISEEDISSIESADKFEGLFREFIKDYIKDIEGRVSPSPLLKNVIVRAKQALDGDKYAVRTFAESRVKEGLKLQESKKVLDQPETLSNMRKAVSEHNDAFRDYVDSIVETMPVKEKIWNGTDDYGRNKYVAHTIENVVKKLKKDLRGGESFNYGMPNVRAAVTPKFKSIADIQANKHRIVSKEEFEIARDALEKEGDSLANQLGVGTLDIYDVLWNAIDENTSKAFSYAGIKDTQENRMAVDAFLNKLKALPTEYFEGKAKDITQFSNFAGAVVPDNLAKNAYDVLEKSGVKIFTYNSTDPKSRIEAIKQATNQLDEERGGDILFSRANTMQSALDLAMTGVAHSEPTVWDSLKAKDFTGFKERFNRAVGKVDEWLADSLRPVNDWIDSMHLEDQTGNTSSRDHEKRRLKDAMYTAKGKRDALNSELEQAYLKPILSKIAALSKETKKSNHYIDELTMKRMVGNWISARYSIEKNIDLLNRDEKVMRDTKRLLDNAKQNGTSAEVRRLNEAYLKAKEQYDNRKADIYNTDYKNKGNRFKVGVAGGWSIPEAELIMSNTEKHISRSNLESVAELVYDLNQSRLDIDRASGRYTEAEYQEYKANRHYVPLTGDPNADVDVDIISGAGSNALNIARDKTLKGRTSSEAEDAIDAVWKSIGKSTTYAGFAEFKSRIDDLFETEVTLLKDKGYSDAEAREQATANLGISKRKMQGLTRSSDNVLIRKEGSDYYEYELPTQVMESLRNDNVEHANAFLKVISKPTGWYARGVTQWTVTFAPMNMLRDTWEKSEFIRVQKLYDKNNRLVDSKTMDKIGRDTIKNALADKEVWQATKRLGFGQELRDSVPAERMLKQLLKEGGVSNYGTYLDKSEVDLVKKLRKENNPLAGKLEKAGKVLEGYNKMFDTVSALASYKALVENGIDSKQAAATTLELTNFRKTGSKMRGIKALYMFSQPTVMGAANLMRYLSTRKGQIRFAAYMAVMTSLYTVLRSMDDEDEGGNKMDQLGDITRYIPIPLGDGKYFKIPVGFGMAQMAWNFSTNIVKGAVGDISLTEAGTNMLVHSMKTFSPVSPSEISAAKYPLEKITLTATPSILQPVMQNVLNRSAFGNKITTNYVRDDKLKAEQSKATTAQFWKDVAIDLNDSLGIDMHPEQIKNLFDGYGSMIGSLKELNTVFVENPNREQLGRKTRTPFLNQFIGTTNEFAIQSRYYEASDEAKTVYNEYKSRKERNELGDWLDADKMKLIKFHEEEESVIKKARSEKAKLTRALRSGNISAVAYENGIKRYNKEMSAVQAKLLRKYRQMEGLNTH